MDGVSASQTMRFYTFFMCRNPWYQQPNFIPPQYFHESFLLFVSDMKAVKTPLKILIIASKISKFTSLSKANTFCMLDCHNSPQKSHFHLFLWCTCSCSLGRKQPWEGHGNNLWIHRPQQQKRYLAPKWINDDKFRKSSVQRPLKITLSKGGQGQGWRDWKSLTLNKERQMP